MIVKEDFDIKNFTSFKIGGKVSKVYFPQTEEEFVNLLKDLDEYIVLGSCSNILMSSNGFNGNIILTNELKNYEISGTHVKASAGVKGQLLSKETASKNLSGFEFMIGFPGSIGGNIFMNAGAHGQCISDCLVRCCLFDVKAKKVIYKTKEELNFKYRYSDLKTGKFVLINAEFKLEKKEAEKIQELIVNNQEFRKKFQPNLAHPNAGSVFKNPENDSAGRLLDSAGVKMLSADNVEVWPLHANFIVNKGGATSEDVLDLMFKMYNTVKQKYGIELEPEIIYIGNKTEKEGKEWNILYQKTLK